MGGVIDRKDSCPSISAESTAAVKGEVLLFIKWFNLKTVKLCPRSSSFKALVWKYSKNTSSKAADNLSKVFPKKAETAHILTEKVKMCFKEFLTFLLKTSPEFLQFLVIYKLNVFTLARVSARLLFFWQLLYYILIYFLVYFWYPIFWQFLCTLDDHYLVNPGLHFECAFSQSCDHFGKLQLSNVPVDYWVARGVFYLRILQLLKFCAPSRK